jgi:hypothetical protein
MANVNHGFKGIATINSDEIRCSDFSVNPQQSMTFYDHVIGLNDTIPTGHETKGEEPGVIQTQKKYARPSPISINGGISFPAMISNKSSNFESLFEYAKYGNYFPMTYRHYCQSGREYHNCRVNSFSFSVVAGDILQISSDIYAMFFEPISSNLDFATSQKIITSDSVHIEIIEKDDDDKSGFTTDSIQALDFSINNNLTEIYTAQPVAGEHDLNLFPRDLRLGMQEVSGTISIYIAQGIDFLKISTQKLKLKLTVFDFSTEINCILQPKQINGVVGPVIVSIPFIGVDKVFGD